MPQTETDEKELIRLLQDDKTKRDAFNKVVTQYQKRLYWQIRKMVASHDDTDDILQNTFIKAWTNIDKFRGESSLMTWLYRIATNETLDFLSSAHARHSAQNSKPFSSYQTNNVLYLTCATMMRCRTSRCQKF